MSTKHAPTDPIKHTFQQHDFESSEPSGAGRKQQIAPSPLSLPTRQAAGSAVAELRTSGGDETTSRNVIGAVHGSGLAAQLFDFEASSEEPRFSCRGLASGPQWTQRSLSLTLFINHRLVECPGIRKAVEAVFAPVLPRHQHPWAYIALDIDPTTVDVNVHPTKQEVQFLFEEAIAQRIQEVLSAKLTERAGVRSTACIIRGASGPPAGECPRVAQESRRSRSQRALSLRIPPRDILRALPIVSALGRNLVER